MATGSRIRDFRKQRGKTIDELVKQVGISRSFLSAVERGEKKPSVNTLKKIAETLNVPVSYLVTDMSDNNVGKKIKLIREGRNLDFEDLAERSGIPVWDLQTFEEGTTNPTMDQLERLADALGVTIRYFLENLQNTTSVGKRVKNVRESKGLTVIELADKSGVSPGLVSQVEHEQVVPSLQTLEQVAKALDTSVCYFLLEQQDITDLLTSLSSDMIELLGDPRVQAVLRAIRDLNQGELRFILNQIDFFRKYSILLKQ